MVAVHRWLVHEPEPAATAMLVKEFGLPPLVARLLANRGLSDREAASAFIEPKLADLPDPFLMADAQVAAVRLSDAIKDGEMICVYGDYDVDGITSSALLHSFLDKVGARVRVFLPDRIRDGYGLNAERLIELCDDGVELFVSADCGSRAVEAIDKVRSRDIDFIVCDHHTLGEILPRPNALLNPHREDCQYPDKRLSAVGVSLVLVQAVRRILMERGHFGDAGRPPNLGSLLEFAALGTIADMVPLRGVNRIIAKHGLLRLGRSRRPGIQALARHTDIKRAANADHVGFYLGPRINAAGRIADAHTAFELLTTEDVQRAEQLATELEVENNRRKKIQAEVSSQAMELAAEQPGHEHAVVVAADGWHPGVVGIVATRLKEHFHVPVFVLALDGESARGSGRSISGYDLVAGLRAVAGQARPDGLLQRYGGHYYAAGISLARDQVDAFRNALVAHVSQALPIAERKLDLHIDAELTVGDLNLDKVAELDMLEPCGKGNHRPYFLVRGAVLAELRCVGKDLSWARFQLAEQSDRPLWGRQTVGGFGKASLFEGIEQGQAIDMVFRLERNNYRNRTSVQATVVEVAPAGEHSVSVLTTSSV